MFLFVFNDKGRHTLTRMHTNCFPLSCQMLDSVVVNCLVLHLLFLSKQTLDSADAEGQRVY